MKLLYFDGAFAVTRLCGNGDDDDDERMVVITASLVLFVVKIQTIVNLRLFIFIVFTLSLFRHFVVVVVGVVAGNVCTTINYILRVTNSFRNEKCFARLRCALSICMQSQNAEAVAFSL